MVYRLQTYYANRYQVELAHARRKIMRERYGRSRQ